MGLGECLYQREKLLNLDLEVALREQNSQASHQHIPGLLMLTSQALPYKMNSAFLVETKNNFQAKFQGQSIPLTFSIYMNNCLQHKL